MFAWAPVPRPVAALGSMAFSKFQLREAEVAVSPGIGFGEYGEGYVRIGPSGGARRPAADAEGGENRVGIL
jgi:alanine-synthesizing transaminase